MNIVAIRAATTVDVDSKSAIEEAVVELIAAMMKANNLTEDNLISILFTSTPDLKSEFPATAARKAGLSNTPLICAQELDIAGALPRTIRLMVHASSEAHKGQIEHVYLRNAVALRKDLNK